MRQRTTAECNCEQWRWLQDKGEENVGSDQCTAAVVLEDGQEVLWASGIIIFKSILTWTPDKYVLV